MLNQSSIEKKLDTLLKLHMFPIYIHLNIPLNLNLNKFLILHILNYINIKLWLYSIKYIYF